MIKLIEFLIPVLILFISFVYYWLRQRYQFWRALGVPHSKTKSLLFGNEYEFITGKLTVAESSEKHYNNLAPHKYGGVYNFWKPVLYVRDPELIKNILIKDFHHFHDRNFFLSNKDDPLSQHLFNITGEEWKALRSKLTPTFTSGKMKLLFDLIEECIEKLNEIIEKNALHDGAVDVYDLISRFAIDVITSCAFGLEADSLHNADSIFRLKGRERFRPSWRARLRQALIFLCPNLISFLRYQEVPQDVSDFFINLLNDTIQYRKKNGVVRKDFLQLLMEIQNDESEDTKRFDFNTGVLAAQCFVFLVAGFETTSTLSSLTLYKLAEHPNIQKKLQAEVDDVLTKNHGRVDYNCLQEMHYLDKVINETLRLFPPAPRLIRVCTENYRMPDSDYLMTRGQQVVIPTCALMRDPQYFPDPDVFNPENFSEEAKLSRPACTFLPFGTGPRNCIGMRFALMEAKLVLARIMKEYTISLSPEMELPIKFNPYIVISTLESKILLNFSKREMDENRE